MKYSEEIMETVRGNMGLKDHNDTKYDEIINKMDKTEVFERFLRWHGIVGYGDMILAAIEEIFNCDFDTRSFYEDDE